MSLDGYVDLEGTLDRQEKALRLIGYSAHSGEPRFGSKAQAARWGLGEDTLPVEYHRFICECGKPTSVCKFSCDFCTWATEDDACPDHEEAYRICGCPIPGNN